MGKRYKRIGRINVYEEIPGSEDKVIYEKKDEPVWPIFLFWLFFIIAIAAMSAEEKRTYQAPPLTNIPTYQATPLTNNPSAIVLTTQD